MYIKKTNNRVTPIDDFHIHTTPGKRLGSISYNTTTVFNVTLGIEILW